MALIITHSQILGNSEEHVQDLPSQPAIKIHYAVIQPLQELVKAASSAGFNLQVASGFRSFERQLHIWNRKCCGERPVLNSDGDEIDVRQLTVKEKINAILRWSALPGASRHHWGTECDIYDAAAVPDSYALQLHPDEYTNDGPFAPMMSWLEEYLQQTNSPDFYRPYLSDHQGVAAEPWHLSYRPIAREFEQYMSPTIIQHYLQSLGDHMIEEKQILLDNFSTIYQRFIHPSNDNTP